MDFIKTFEQLDPANSLSKDQIDFLNKYADGPWNIVNGFVDIEGDFRLINAGEKDFKGIKFGKVSGHFFCSENQLTSLEWAPQEVGGHFNCSSNLLTSLDGCPQEIIESFFCNENRLTSLKEGPKKVGIVFNCSSNQLTSLEGCPPVIGGYFNCSHNQLASLVGGPSRVYGLFDCSHNQLTSFVGFPIKLSGDFEFENNLVSDVTLQLLWDKLKEIPIYAIALASIWSEIPEEEQKLMKKDLDPDYLDYSQLGYLGLI